MFHIAFYNSAVSTLDFRNPDRQGVFNARYI
jgi:hypothetical protein